jgi:integrase
MMSITLQAAITCRAEFRRDQALLTAYATEAPKAIRPAFIEADVLTTRRGRPLGPRYVIRSYRRMLRRAGISHRRLYDLRHTCASLLLVRGVHPRVVMDILGHSQISLTMNTYSHVIPELQQEAATRLDDLLKGSS